MYKKPPFRRKVKIFFREHWVKFLVIFGITLLVILSVVGLMSLESFYRKLTLAQAPITLLLGMFNAAIFVFMYLTFFRNGLSKSNKKNRIEASDTQVKFDDVVGIDEAKQEAKEVVELILDHKKLKKIGGKIMRGLLMVGPPGCGKTLLAKAIASEAGIPFLSTAGSEFVEMFVGVGAKRIRDLFSQARNLAYANGGCIIFVDELDVIGEKRNFSDATGSGSERKSTLNQFLVEMDGLRKKSDEENIIIIGATNAAEDFLDPALLRPGRFDRKVYITLPSLDGREKIFQYYLDKVTCDDTVNVSRIARLTIGKTPADIENIVKEAALIAVREESEKVGHAHLSAAIERIELGMKHARNITDKDKEKTAYHETGHLMAVYLLHPTDEVFKASIIPRKQTLGVVYHQPREELFSHDRDKWLADIKVALGGYVAEKMQYGTTSDGVYSDFQHATNKANLMVWKLGMSSYDGDSTPPIFGDYSSIPEDCRSEDLKKRLNQETDKILRYCYQEVEKMLRNAWPAVEHIVQDLLKKEELEYDEVEEICKMYGLVKKTREN